MRARNPAAPAAADVAPLPVLQRVRALTDGVIVALSTGKDSLAVLDLAARNFTRVVPFFMYRVKGLEFQERALRMVERRYGFEVLRLPHWALSRMYRTAAFAPHGAIREDVPRLSLGDVERTVREKTGLVWIFSGEKTSDSLVRNAMLKRAGGMDESTRRAWPIWDWKDATVFGYLRQRGIPLPPEYRAGARHGISDLTGPELVRIKREYPDDYARILAAFPFIEAEVKRREFFVEERGAA